MAPPTKNPYAKAELDWALRGFMVPHGPMRLYTPKLADALDSFERLQQQGGRVSRAAAASLRDWYTTYYYPFVQHHHNIEETDFFPWISQRLEERGLGAIPAGIEPQHEGLFKGLDSIGALLSDLVDTCGPEAAADAQGQLISRLQNELKVFARDLLEHLDEEEADVVPLIRKGFTKEEIDAKTTAIIQGLGLAGAKLMVPWIMEAMDYYDPTEKKEHAAAFYQDIPPPLRFLVWASWRSSHERHNKGAIEALASDQLPQPGWCCCA